MISLLISVIVSNTIGRDGRKGDKVYIPPKINILLSSLLQQEAASANIQLEEPSRDFSIPSSHLSESTRMISLPVQRKYTKKL